MSEDDNDFVFKPATSPKLNENVNNSVIVGISDCVNKSNVTSPSVKSKSSETIQQSHNPNPQNVRFPFLDDLIKEKKKEMDLELNKLAKVSLEEFLEREKAADKQRDEELNASVIENSDNTSRVRDIDFSELDKREEEMFASMRTKAQETWDQLKSDYQTSLEHLHLEQSARLSSELQLQESLQASGSVFDRELFEKVVEKCGKGRATAFGREKMARFWEVLDKSYPKGASATSPNKLDEDKLLSSLLGNE